MFKLLRLITHPGRVEVYKKSIAIAAKERAPKLMPIVLAAPGESEGALPEGVGELGAVGLVLLPPVGEAPPVGAATAGAEVEMTAKVVG